MTAFDTDAGEVNAFAHDVLATVRAEQTG
jgi:hypothetical protein